jgi:protein O-GlcNAc transferase
MATMTLQQLFDLALQHHQAGRLQDAEQIYRQILAHEPGHAGALHRVGLLAYHAGRYANAVQLIRQAIVFGLEDAEAYSNLGGALRAQGLLDEAIEAFRRTSVLRPGDPAAQINLGNSLVAGGRTDQAIVAYKRAIALRPGSVEAHNNLGNALMETGQLEEAVAAYRHALDLEPNRPQVHLNLGTALKGQGRLEDAIAAFRKAMELKFDLPEARINLGNALKDAGRLDEAVAVYREAIAANPGCVEAHSNLLLSLHYHASYAPQMIAEEHRGWNRQHAEPLRKYIQPHLNDRSPERRLRVGYVSPDFREHAVAKFLLPLVLHHDRNELEVFAYSNVRIPDATTGQFRAHADNWRRIAGLSDADAAELIRQDQIDILVDLAGHTSGNRLTLMARKPAPIQVTYLGYPNTTGLTAMDYRLSDARADPPGETEKYHSEYLVHLPDGMWCYSPDPEAPTITTSPAAVTGRVIFGSFNQWAKLNRHVLRLWGMLLMRVHGAQLLLKGAAQGDTSGRRSALEVLATEGVTEDRVHFIDRAPTHAQHMAQYRLVDIALDPFPYNGATTTCEALWMGLPVVVLAGRSHVSRVGVSLLSRAGLSELIAETPEQYLKIASELANDIPRLAMLRSSLRDRMRQSPLMDGPRFARNLEAAYRQMWRNWCKDGAERASGSRSK